MRMHGRNDIIVLEPSSGWQYHVRLFGSVSHREVRHDYVLQFREEFIHYLLLIGEGRDIVGVCDICGFDWVGFPFLDGIEDDQVVQVTCTTLRGSDPSTKIE